MKAICLAASLAILLPAIGCHQPSAAMEPQSTDALDAALIDFHRTEAIENAIIRQHTMYPYLFVPGGAELNELGRHDLHVLARHFRGTPGVLGVRRGDADEALYAARVSAVRAVLVEHGVDPHQVVISDADAGGDALDSQTVLRILEPRSETAPDPQTGATTHRQMQGGLQK